MRKSVVTKLLFGNYINKVPSKILYFGHSVDIIRQNKGARPNMGIHILPITL